MRVECEVAEVDIDNEDTGQVQEGVLLTCSRCDHMEESFGTSEKSVRRCLVLMRENCEFNEENFYVVKE